ncbi:hypothetical protein GOBAR_AA14734 [Gossypium barbadense]|uniref:Uncharacterized protein n=1 Tax=Gossypium barbadense TaxID=3634 RepID=A0A2P5XRD9_GOSBA|nr:hypothetical protein GOBAR_AA14734 [Gossypium barbadense]
MDNKQITEIIYCSSFIPGKEERIAIRSSPYPIESIIFKQRNKTEPESPCESQRSHRSACQESEETRHTLHQNHQVYAWSGETKGQEGDVCIYWNHEARNHDQLATLAHWTCHCSGFQPPPPAATL